MSDKTAAILSIVVTLLLFVLGPAILVYIADPFQVYHKPVFRNQGYSKEQAWQHAGWINQLLADPEENYQAIVIGSSTMANYTEELINQYMAWGKTLNLSVNGSTPSMQYTIASHALAKKPDIKHVMWDVHMFFVFDPDPAHPDQAEKIFPYYLYNNSIIDDKPYLFNITNLKTGLEFMKGNFEGFDAGIEDNGPFYKELAASGQYEQFNSYENRKNNLLPQLVDIERTAPDVSYYSAQKFPSLDRYLLDSLLQLCNQPTEVIITFSPATRYSYAILGDIGFLNKQLLMRRYLVEKTASCKNFRVFAFDNVDWIVANLDNYADNYHYRITINEYIVKSIATNNHILTTKNIGDYEKSFIENINGYKAVFINKMEKAQ